MRIKQDRIMFRIRENRAQNEHIYMGTNTRVRLIKQNNTKKKKGKSIYDKYLIKPNPLNKLKFVSPSP